MRIAKLTLQSIAVAVMLGGAAANADENEDEAAIRDLQGRQAEAWNRRDAGAYASLFAEKADLVNALGWWWVGRAEISENLNTSFQTVFRDSILTIDGMSLRFLARDTAVAHVQWSMIVAAAHEAGPGRRRGLQTQVLRRENGEWVIVAFQDTQFAAQDKGR